jgi:hypothetical protein
MNGPVEVIDEFLSSDECARLAAAAPANCWRPSLSGLPDARSVLSARGGRHSDSVGEGDLDAAGQELLPAIEARLADRCHALVDRFEPWQMSRYRRGDFFDYHLDCGAFGTHPSGERERTFLLVVQAPACGGVTHFRALGVSVRPIAGRLITWRNFLPSGRCNHGMIHSGRPVWQGQKIILTTWQHERPFPRGASGRGSGHEASQ